MLYESDYFWGIHKYCVNTKVQSRGLHQACTVMNSLLLTYLVLTVSPVESHIAYFFFNSSPPGQNDCHFTDNIFKCIFVNEKFRNSIQIAPKFVPKGLVDNKSVLVQVHWYSSAPNRPQAITWTNAKPDHQCIMWHIIPYGVWHWF